MSKQAKAQATINVVYPSSLDFTFHDVTDTSLVKQIQAGDTNLNLELGPSTEFLLEQHYYVVKVALYNDQVG